MSGDIFDYHDRGGWCYWYLVGRGQGCCYMSYSTQDSTRNKVPLSQNVSSAKLEKGSLSQESNNGSASYTLSPLKMHPRPPSHMYFVASCVKHLTSVWIHCC